MQQQFVNKPQSPNLLLWIGVPALLVLIVMAVAAFFGWRAFVRFGVASDLDKHYFAIRDAHGDSQAKQELLAKVSAARATARARSISFFVWVPFNERVNKCLADNVITADEVRFLGEEYDRLQQDFE